MVIIGVLTAVSVINLYILQIVKGDDYLLRSQRSFTRTDIIRAPRGEILDRYGRPLVTNKGVFTVQFNAPSWSKEKRAGVILKLIDMITPYGIAYTDTMPVTKTTPFQYLNSAADEAAAKKLKKFISDRKWEEKITAPEFVKLMSERYKLPEPLTDLQRRTVIGVLYEMEQNDFSSYNPYTFAFDLPIELTSRIREELRKMPGVSIEVDTVREYKTPYAAHILGRVAPIYKEEYQELKEKGYKMTDVVGKDGIEKAYESVLRGIDGSQTVETSKAGKITNVLNIVPPEVGKNCQLTIDLRLQEVAEKSLAAIIPKLRKEGLQNKNWGGIDAKGGAIVAIEVKTGDVLVMASNPTFSLENYSKDYNTLVKDKYLPLFNRAIMGAYPPGSTFKMVTALCGLESGVITANTQIRCDGVYKFYAPTYQPQCDIYRRKKTTHGYLDVSSAIKVSCNYFFYETGRLETIERLEPLARRFGFGSKTGIEISGEASGTMTGPEFSKKQNQKYVPGKTISAAIGQADTTATPIQIANYIATLCNNGVRLKPHLLKNVVDPMTGEITDIPQPEVLDTINFKEENLKTVLDGMRRGAKEQGGTAYATFGAVAYTVGTKTGSAQATAGSHAVFVAFAPFDDPEIAIACVVENGGQGSRIASLAKDVLNAYFSPEAGAASTSQGGPENKPMM